MKDYTQLGRSGWRTGLLGHAFIDVEKLTNEIFLKIKKEFPETTYEYYSIDIPYFTKNHYGYISGRLRNFIPKTLKKTGIKKANYFVIKINGKEAIRFYRVFKSVGMGWFYHKEFNDDEVSRIKQTIKQYDYYANFWKFNIKSFLFVVIILIIILFIIQVF